MQGGQWQSPVRKGVSLMVTVSDALTLMISFATLIVAVIAVTTKK
ncbi:putative holin-like toxin [Fictibacillus nanhaiensis]